jgi:nucleoid-associated protein YgaU
MGHQYNGHEARGGKPLMDRFEELKAKYQPALQEISENGVRLAHLHVQDNKLFMQGAAPNQEVIDQVWNKIKSIDSGYGDLTCDLRIDVSLPQPPKTYQVKPGDSLWKIAQSFYGRGNLFQRIVEANPDKLRDANSIIHPGDLLKIPA